MVLLAPHIQLPATGELLSELTVCGTMQGACGVVTSGAAVTAGFVGLYVADFCLNFQSIKCVPLQGSQSTLRWRHRIPRSSAAALASARLP